MAREGARGELRYASAALRSAAAWGDRAPASFAEAFPDPADRQRAREAAARLRAGAPRVAFCARLVAGGAPLLWSGRLAEGEAGEGLWLGAELEEGSALAAFACGNHGPVVEELLYRERIDEVARLIEQSGDAKQLLEGTLELLRARLGVDRAWLVHPCDPAAGEWKAVLERTSPRYPGLFVEGVSVPQDDSSRAIMIAALGQPGPVSFGSSPGDVPWPDDNWGVRERYRIRSQVVIALHPRRGAPWMLGLHQCSFDRTWSAAERRLLRDVGARVQDGLTNLLLFDELRRAKDEAEEASRLKSEFMDVASHELRTPLTTMLLVLQRGLQQLERGQPVEAGALRRVERSALRLSGLVEDLLDVARLHSGRLVIRPHTIDLRQLVEEALEDFRQQVPERPVVAQLPDAAVLVEADETRVVQVLANLLDNARKYSPPGSRIDVAVQVRDGRTRVSVEDRGLGIEPDLQSKLFTPFFRAHSDYRQRNPGLGLGLYICHEIVVRHGGTIDVSSQPGRGSTFSFTLPPAAAARATRSPGPVGAEPVP